MSRDPRNGLGRQGEAFAAAHLGRRGFDVLERNYRTRFGELDIVAFDGRTIAFCEVKSRRVRSAAADGGARGAGRGGDALSPFASIHPRKQAHVRRMATQWLAERLDRPRAALLRFDAIGIWIDPAGRLLRLEHLEGAF